MAFALAGCIADGRYVVRGRVTADTEGRTTPIAGASVKVGLGRRAGQDNGLAWTSADGTYAADYSFGGMWPFIEGGDPAAEVSAPGFLSTRYELREPASTPGVTRRPCGTAAETWCFVRDVVLRPDTRTGASLLQQRERGLKWTEASSLFTDVTGDGVPDLVVLGVSAEQVAVGIVAGPLNGESRVWAHRFAIARGLQDGVCGPPESVKLTPEDLGIPLYGCSARSPPECRDLLATSVRLEAAKSRGARAIRLDSGDCDAFHIYLDEDQVRWWRR